MSPTDGQKKRAAQKNRLTTAVRSAKMLKHCAEMAEWSNAAVLKTVDGQLSGGSNPSLCATAKGTLGVPFAVAQRRSIKHARGSYRRHAPTRRGAPSGVSAAYRSAPWRREEV